MIKNMQYFLHYILLTIYSSSFIFFCLKKRITSHRYLKLFAEQLGLVKYGCQKKMKHTVTFLDIMDWRLEREKTCI